MAENGYFELISQEGNILLKVYPPEAEGEIGRAHV